MYGVVKMGLPSSWEQLTDLVVWELTSLKVLWEMRQQQSESVCLEQAEQKWD